MKTAALAVLGAVCALTGQYIAFSLSRRVLLLEKIQLMLSAAQTQLSYLSTPSDKLVEILADNPQLSGLTFIPECREKMESGSDFRTAWRESLSEKNTRFLKKDDVSLLLSFGDVFGTTDTAGQLSNCSLHAELLQDKLDTARRARERYGALSGGMGIIAGIGLIIILI